jgi:MEDS: MEthanogen/methylotroph, DcmR Sensory domain
VQFYGDDGALLHELKSHIGKALTRGSSAIIIATSGHIDGLAHKLKGQGIDLDKAKAEGRYIALEASEVLSKFMVDGLPDRALFSNTIGQVIAQASGASLDENRRVVAFGEMVALLWAEGKCDAAIQLEKLWNELAKTYFFFPSLCLSDARIFPPRDGRLTDEDLRGTLQRCAAWIS